MIRVRCQYCDERFEAQRSSAKFCCPSHQRLFGLMSEALRLHAISPAGMVKYGDDERALRRIIAKRKRRIAAFKPRHPRRWWEGLSDRERAQHAVKSNRGVFESYLRMLARAYRANVPEEKRLICEQWRQQLEAAEIRVGLRPDPSAAKPQ